jgi:hypothetical protein
MGSPQRTDYLFFLLSGKAKDPSGQPVNTGKNHSTRGQRLQLLNADLPTFNGA